MILLTVALGVWGVGLIALGLDKVRTRTIIQRVQYWYYRRQHRTVTEQELARTVLDKVLPQ
jgi:hypothetical protein